MRYSNEIKVGAVVLLGLTVITLGYFKLRGVGLGAQIYYLKLDGAAAIAQGNDVRLQGVKIGQVQEVGFDPIDQKPLITLAVRRSDPPFRMLKTYVYSVQSAGIVGENYVDIRGQFIPTGAVYSENNPNQKIPGKATTGLLGVTDSADAIVKDLRTTLKNLNVTLTNINRGVLNPANQQKLARTLDGTARLTNSAAGLLADSRNQNGLRQTLQNVQAASKNAEMASQNIALASRQANAIASDLGASARGTRLLVGDLRGNLNGIINENRGELRMLLQNVSGSAKNIAGLTETLDFALKQGGFKENAQVAFQSLRRAAENVEVATGGLRKLGEDPQNADSLRATLAALRDSTDALKTTAQGVRDALGTGENSRITTILSSLTATTKNLETTTDGIAQILGDPATQADIKGAANNLNNTLAATRSAAERINALLGGKRKTQTDAPTSAGLEEKTSAPASAFSFPQGASLTARRFSEPIGSARNFGDFEYGLELGGAPFRLGVSEIGESNDLTVQTGRLLNPNLAARYGLYRSKLGVGLEYRAGRFSLEGNIWDPNNRTYNLYGGFSMTKNLDLIAGRDGRDGRQTNSIALRLRQ